MIGSADRDVNSPYPTGKKVGIPPVSATVQLGGESTLTLQQRIHILDKFTYVSHREYPGRISVHSRFIPVCIIMITVLLSSGVCFGQSEWAGGDTSVILFRGGEFISKRPSGLSLSIGIGILGKLNAGGSYLHWTTTRPDASQLYHATDLDHNTGEAYVEYLPIQINDERMSARAGLGIVGGGDEEKRFYFGASGSVYGNLRMGRSLCLTARVGQGIMHSPDIVNAFGRTTFGCGMAFRAGLATLLTVGFDYERMHGIGMTTISGGLAFLISKRKARIDN